MTVKIDTIFGTLTVSGSKSAINGFAGILYDAGNYQDSIGFPVCARKTFSNADKIHLALSSVGYYDDIRLNREKRGVNNDN